MLNVRQILVSAIGLATVGVALAGCGQKGALYLPTDPAATNRATLPGLLVPRSGSADGAASPGAGAAPVPAAASSAPATREGTK
ncbi:LPS translocon maturation chaperone LptM [Variovorax sp. RA8]|uniref:LPS translocon maturation chaperone LptM n=1 Tax=Variovorax sp. (strain JCM 16519 / RA8) TaxID=662548 RepID=UPI001E345557|nr:lipoprotein [Variovorax sp. RA8]